MLFQGQAQNRRRGGGRGNSSEANQLLHLHLVAVMLDPEAHTLIGRLKASASTSRYTRKRLREKTEELEVSRKQCESAKTQLARALKDKAGQPRS